MMVCERCGYAQSNAIRAPLCDVKTREDGVSLICVNCGANAWVVRVPAFRRFELTIGVFLPRGAPLPETFRDWLERATGVSMEDGPATPTTLERVVETAPVEEDVLEKRLAQRSHGGPW